MTDIADDALLRLRSDTRAVVLRSLRHGDEAELLRIHRTRGHAMVGRAGWGLPIGRDRVHSADRGGGRHDRRPHPVLGAACWWSSSPAAS